MSNPALYALTPQGPQPLPAPAGAGDFTDLYGGLTLGVYSVLRTFEHNQFLHLDDHLDRTAESMRLLGWRFQLDRKVLRQALHTLCSNYPAEETRIRIDVLAAPIQVEGSACRVLLALMPFTPLPRQYYEEGVAVGIAPELVRKHPKIKTADFVQLRQQATRTRHQFEQLIVNQRGEILEGASSNFYAVRKGVVYTAGVGVLSGVTRRIILTLCAEAGIPVHLEAVRIVDIVTLDEAALSSSSRGLLPIIAIDGQSIGDGRRGPITHRLMADYEAYVRREIRPALESG